MNRIATATIFERAIAAMSGQQSRLAELQAQVGTGRKAMRPADDPVAASQGASVRGEIARNEVERRMLGFAANILGQADTALGRGTDALDSVRELVLRARNANFTPADRASMAQEIQSLRDELLMVANSRDGAGGFIFGGQGARTAPFVELGGGVVYDAVPGNQTVGLDMSAWTALDGHAAFMAVPDGNGGQQTIFEALDSVVATLSDPSATNEELMAATGATLDGLDGGLEALLLARTKVGEHLRTIERADAALEDGTLDARSRLSGIEDVDYAAALSEFAQVQTSLNAAMQTYAKLSANSLFDYIR